MANFEKLKEAYAIIDGIPANKFRLEALLKKYDPEHLRCGTIACAAGWLSLHPTFASKIKPEVVNVNPVGVVPCWKLQWTVQDGRGPFQTSYYRLAMSKLFGLPPTVDLFRPVDIGERTDSTGRRRSDKEIWLHRVRMFLAAHNQLDCDR